MDMLMQVLAFNSRVVHCLPLALRLSVDSRRLSDPSLRVAWQPRNHAGSKARVLRGGRRRGQLEMDHTWCVVVLRTHFLSFICFWGALRVRPCSRWVSRRLDMLFFPPQRCSAYRLQSYLGFLMDTFPTLRVFQGAVGVRTVLHDATPLVHLSKQFQRPTVPNLKSLPR
jgi:hypothetical protein